MEPIASQPAQNIVKSVLKGAAHVICVAWTVPAVRSQVATLLVRFGLPSALVALGMAVGEALSR